MTNSSTTESTSSPDPVDRLLADWGSQIECNPERIAVMWDRISASTKMDPPPVDHLRVENEAPRPSARTAKGWRRAEWAIGALVAASLISAVGLSLFKFSEPHQNSGNKIAEVKDSLSGFSFTFEELQQTQALAAEFHQLYLTQVLARRTTMGWDIEEAPSISPLVPREDMTDNQTANQTMVIRCLVMESDVSAEAGGVSWRIVSQEEVITNVEYHHLAAKNQLGDVDAWVHLLPNQSLWTECRDKQREEAFLLVRNRPSVVWEEKISDSVFRRFVIVYECLELDKV